MTPDSATRPRNTGQLMLMVVLACWPGGSALVFFFGWGVLLNLIWLPLVTIAMEAAALKARGLPVAFHLRDGSALVTAVLLALALPPTAPWWLGAAGAFGAVVVAKQMFGGTGRNVLNPAMAGYAALLLLFPLQMTRWLLPEGATLALPSFADALTIFLDRDPAAGIDAFTGATVLDTFRQDRGGQLFAEFASSAPVMGAWSGLAWEWINAGFLMGGLYLAYRGVISWHIPGALLATLAAWALLFHDGGSSASLGSPLFHLFGGATMLGAFFVATDPVTAPATPRGKLLYGALIGSLVFAFRAWSAYPDGVAFAVLLGNLAAPALDAVADRQLSTFGAKWSGARTITVAAVAALILAGFAAGLRRPGAERAALAAVMPPTLHDNDLAAASFTLDPATGDFSGLDLLNLPGARQAYRAALNGRPSGVVLPLVAPQGYNGAIELLVGINADGAITGVRAVHHDETRGLGDLIDADASNWIRGFDNRSLENTDEVLWAVKKDGGDFDQFVGATITPRATVSAVHDALQFFEANREALLVAPP